MHFCTHKADATASSRFGAPAAYKKIMQQWPASSTASINGVRTRTSYTPVLLCPQKNKYKNGVQGTIECAGHKTLVPTQTRTILEATKSPSSCCRSKNEAHMCQGYRKAYNVSCARIWRGHNMRGWSHCIKGKEYESTSTWSDNSDTNL